MRFPYDQATWDALKDVMFMGWGGPLPGFYTFAGIVACVIILWIGNRSEKARYNNH